MWNWIDVFMWIWGILMIICMAYNSFRGALLLQRFLLRLLCFSIVRKNHIYCPKKVFYRVTFRIAFPSYVKLQQPT